MSNLDLDLILSKFSFNSIWLSPSIEHYYKNMSQYAVFLRIINSRRINVIDFKFFGFFFRILEGHALVAVNTERNSWGSS